MAEEIKSIAEYQAENSILKAENEELLKELREKTAKLNRNYAAVVDILTEAKTTLDKIGIDISKFKDGFSIEALFANPMLLANLGSLADGENDLFSLKMKSAAAELLSQYSVLQDVPEVSAILQLFNTSPND